MPRPYPALLALLAFSGYTLFTLLQAEQSLLQFAAALLLYVILALAGTCCIAAVQGPDRFEVPKDAQGVTQ